MAVSALLASDCVLIAFFELPYPDYSRSRSPTLTDSSLVYDLERSLYLTPLVSRTIPTLFRTLVHPVPWSLVSLAKRLYVRYSRSIKCPRLLACKLPLVCLC